MPIKKTEKQELLEKLNLLLKKQSLFQQEINELQLQITQLRAEDPKQEPIVKKEEKIQEPVTVVREKPQELPRPQKTERYTPQKKETTLLEDIWKQTGIGSELEQFIGTNLINKIGMIVVIIGVGIGAKYAIDNELISPLMRIVLGYFVGGLLTFFALRLKKKYFNFSALLFSGSMAIYYFITYAAYTYYGLFPHLLTFILMVLFTVLTVVLALYYNRQVIAHYGLAGAYIVPFLLGDPDAGVLVLFVYMVLVNAGILFISTKKRWKALNYVAFVATWVIFMSWFASDKNDDQLGMSLTFASLFFVIFYLVFLSYKLLLKEKLRIDDIVFLLLNSTVYYFVGFIALEGMSVEVDNSRFHGLFTLINVLIHSLSAYVIYKSEREHKGLFYWTIGMVVAFATVAIGVQQFSPFIVAMLWSIEAAILFWLGRTKKIALFDYMSFAIVCITFIAVIINWFSVSYTFNIQTIKEIYQPIFSQLFLSELIIISSFSFIYFTSQRNLLPKGKLHGWKEVFNLIFPVFFLIIVFFSLYTEIDLFWNNIQIYTSYKLNHNGIWVKAYESLNHDIFTFKFIWLVNYSLLFVSILAFTNLRWMKNDVFNAFIFVMAGLMIIIFLSGVLHNLGVLRTSYLKTSLPANYDVNVFHLLIRYVAYMFFALLFYSVYRFTLPLFTNKNFKKIFEIVLSVTLITICSSELTHWLSLSGSTEVYKYWLSILWGVLSFLLIGYGIWKKKKHLRVTSIILFGGTIIKLFVYDLTNLETVPKTIVFISIGALLLVVSFMYNKYKDLIFGSD